MQPPHQPPMNGQHGPPPPQGSGVPTPPQQQAPAPPYYQQQAPPPPQYYQQAPPQPWGQQQQYAPPPQQYAPPPQHYAPPPQQQYAPPPPQQYAPPPPQYAQPPQYGTTPGTGEVRTLWIGDLQYWMDENYLHYTAFAPVCQQVILLFIFTSRKPLQPLHWKSEGGRPCTIGWANLVLI